MKLPPIVKRKMINVHHMYNKCTTPFSHGVGPTVHVMYGNHLQRSLLLSLRCQAGFLIQGY
jgi:hypothetical protein